jgi:hypothetical protein
VAYAQAPEYEENSFLSLIEYGYYCGPGKSGDDFTLTPLDELDALCREHDLCYVREHYFNMECDTAHVQALQKLLANAEWTKKAPLMTVVHAMAQLIWFQRIAPLGSSFLFDLWRQAGEHPEFQEMKKWIEALIPLAQEYVNKLRKNENIQDPQLILRDVMQKITNSMGGKEGIEETLNHIKAESKRHVKALLNKGLDELLDILLE